MQKGKQRKGEKIKGKKKNRKNVPPKRNFNILKDYKDKNKKTVKKDEKC